MANYVQPFQRCRQMCSMIAVRVMRREVGLGSGLSNTPELAMIPMVNRTPMAFLAWAGSQNYSAAGVVLLAVGRGRVLFSGSTVVAHTPKTSNFRLEPPRLARQSGRRHRGACLLGVDDVSTWNLALGPWQYCRTKDLQRCQLNSQRSFRRPR